MATLIRNGLIVTGENVFAGDLLIKNGKITEIGTGTTKLTEEIVDAAGKYVLPGGVDGAVRLGGAQAGIPVAADFESGSRAAALGGTTTVLSPAPPLKGSSRRGLEDLVKKTEGRSAVDYSFHAALTNFNERTTGEIPLLVKAGVTSFLGYLDHLEAQLHEGHLFQILRAVAESGGIVGIHAGAQALAQCLEKEQLKSSLSPGQAFAASRPPQLEALAVHSALQLAELAGANVFIPRLSSAHALEKLKICRDKGVPVFGETAPHYLVLSEEKADLPDFESAKYLCNPPLRPEWHLDSLWRGIRSGDIQMVGSDHLPFRFDGQKSLGRKDFRKIPPGLPGLEHRLLLLYNFGVAAGKISLSRLVQLACCNPAKLFGLYPQKGALSIGSDADLVILNPEGLTKVAATSQAMNVDYTPYEGLELKGAVERVYLRGKPVVKDGQFVGDLSQGKFLSRATPVLV